VGARIDVRAGNGAIRLMSVHGGGHNLL